MAHFKGIKDQIRIPVEAVIPEDDDRETTVRFSLTFKVPDLPTARKILLETDPDGREDDEVIEEWLVAWSGIQDVNDEDIPFSKENLAEAMRWKPYRDAIVGGFQRAMLGKKKELAKN